MAQRSLHIVFAEGFDDLAVNRMRAVGNVTILDSCDEATLTESVRGCDALLVRTYARVTRGVMDQASRLKVIGRGGVGLENIDLPAARERGITVVYTPAAATDAVAELTFGLMIALIRNIKGADGAVRNGRFYEARQETCSRELSELTLGIIGLGRIGRAVARRAQLGFGMTVLYNDIVSPGPLDFVATPVDKERLYREADVISLHVTLTDNTRHLIDETTLGEFKAGAVLINTARGAVVDSEALARGLSSGVLAGAALDVFEPEPLPVDHPLRSAPNTLFTPHVGARTRGGLARMNDVVEDVIGVLRGDAPQYPAWK